MGFFGVYIIPKWLIKVPGHFGILFGWFRELRKFCQNLVPEPSGLSPKCFKKYKKNMGSSWKNIIFVNMGHQKFRKFSESVCPRYQFVGCICFVFSPFFMLFFEYIFWKYCYEDEELKTIHFSLLNSTPTWIWVSFMSKKHEMDFTLNFLFSKNVP